MNATSDEDGTGWGWLPSADISSLLRFFSLLFGLVVSFYGLLGFRPFAVLVASLRLRWNTLKGRTISGDILRRPGIRNALLTNLNDSDSMFETILVYGPRGSGKTTAIQEVLKDEWGVVQFSIDTNDPEKVPEEFKNKLASKLGSKFDDADFCVSVFEMLKKKKPIVVVSLDSKCSGRVLTQVLLVCKQFAFEAQATRIIVDLSVSRAALQVDVRLSDLRTQGVYVGELDNNEAQLYLSTRLAKSQSNKDQQNLIDLAFDSVGGRLLDLQRLCRECSHLPTKDSIQEHILKRKRTVEHDIVNSWNSFLAHLDNCEKEKPDREKVKKILKDLPDFPASGWLRMENIGLTLEALSIANTSVSYHPFIIDPFEKTVTYNGKKAQDFLRKWAEEQD